MYMFYNNNNNTIKVLATSLLFLFKVGKTALSLEKCDQQLAATMVDHLISGFILNNAEIVLWLSMGYEYILLCEPLGFTLNAYVLS